MSNESLPNAIGKKGRHKSDSQPRSGENEHFDELAFLFEVLSDHYHSCITRHRDANANDESVADKELVKLGGKRCEKTAECRHQSTKYGGKTCAFTAANRNNNR